MFAMVCLAQATMGQFGQYQGVPNAYQNQQQPRVQGRFYVPSPFQMLPQDQQAVNQLGSQGVDTGIKALNIASNLAKNVFPESGPIITPDGGIQTKWGTYELGNPQDRDIVEKLLDATRALLKKIPIVE